MLSLHSINPWSFFYFFFFFFFFFKWRYNPWWVLACFTISFHNLPSLHFSLQFLTFIFFKSSFSHSSFLLSSSYHNPFHALVVLFYRNYSLEPSQQCRFLQCAVASCTPNPLLRRTEVSLLIWVITFDLSGMGGPTGSYTTAGIALRII